MSHGYFISAKGIKLCNISVIKTLYLSLKFYIMSIKQASSIINKKMSIFSQIKDLCAHHPGYIGKFTEYLFSSDIEFAEFRILFERLRKLNDKEIKLNIYEYGYEELIDKIQNSENKLGINKVISQFTSMIKSDYHSCNDYHKLEYFPILLDLSKRDDLGDFINRISRYKTIKELCTAAILFLKDGIHDEAQIIEIASQLENTHIVYHNNANLILQVDSQDDIQKLAYDTSWCIVTSKNNWNYYTRNRIQFIWYNFSLDSCDTKSKVGITIERNGSIHSSYDKINKHSQNETLKSLEKLNIDLFEIIHRKVVSITSFAKLTTKSSYQKYEDFAAYCEIKDITKFIRKLVSFDRNDTKRINSIVALALSRYYEGDVLDTDIDKDFKIPLAYRLMYNTTITNRIYSNNLNNLANLSSNMIVKYIDTFNYNSISLDSVMSAMTGYKSLPDSTMLALRNHMLSIQDCILPESKNTFYIVLFLINNILNDGIELPNSDWIFSIISYDDKLTYCKSLGKYKITLLPGEDGLISHNLNPEYIELQDYNNIFLNRNNHRHVVSLLENSSEFQMGIIMSRNCTVSSISDWYISHKFRNMFIDFVKAPEEITTLIYGNITLKRST